MRISYYAAITPQTDLTVTIQACNTCMLDFILMLKSMHKTREDSLKQNSPHMVCPLLLYVLATNSNKLLQILMSVNCMISVIKVV